MSKLVLVDSNTGKPDKEIILHAGTKIRIGSETDNDLVITHPSVSAYHAEIYTERQDSFLHDNDSASGTLVNGKPIRNHALDDSDIINVGKYTLRFYQSKNLPAENYAQASLKILTGKNTGRIIPLKNDLTTIGDPGVQVAAINHREGGYFFSLLDEGSGDINSFINGQPTPNSPTKLKHKDRLSIASTTLEFLMEP